MGMASHDAYVLLISGEDYLPFLDGLSTNHVIGSCTSVFTDRAAKIIDACEIIDLGTQAAVIGYGPHKNALLNHLSSRILGQKININDISNLNRVYVGDGEDSPPEGTTIHQSYLGVFWVVPIKHQWEPTWSADDWNEYRVLETIPFHGYEIIPKYHPMACGLGDLIHQNKGCYIGQEVLTRMRSRGKQGHQLVRVENPAASATTVGSTHSLCIVRVQ